MDRDLDAIEKLDLNLLGILETHVHADHITAAYDIRKKIGVLIYYGSESGVDGADILLKDGDAIQVGQFDIKTIHTPGHTAGCVCYYTCGMLFTGDTLFIGGTGRTDFQGGSAGLLYDNVVIPGSHYLQLVRKRSGIQMLESKLLKVNLLKMKETKAGHTLKKLISQYPPT